MLSTRIEYEAFAYREPELTEQLTDDEKLEHIGVEQVRHVLALFFLLKHIDIHFDQTDEDLVNMALRNVGELGSLISEGIFASFDTAIDRLKKVTTSTDGENASLLAPISTKGGEIK